MLLLLLDQKSLFVKMATMKAQTKKVGSALAALEGVVTGEEKVGPTKANTRPQFKVIDELSRKRRLKRELDSLERDNFQEDPHANLTLSKKVPRFEDGPKSVGGERRKSNIRLRALNLAQLIEEDSKRNPPNYTTATAPSPDRFNLPRRRFCAVCGLTGTYTCVTCGDRFCSIYCRDQHKETRCMKWIA